MDSADQNGDPALNKSLAGKSISSKTSSRPNKDARTSLNFQRQDLHRLLSGASGKAKEKKIERLLEEMNKKNESMRAAIEVREEREQAEKSKQQDNQKKISQQLDSLGEEKQELEKELIAIENRVKFLVTENEEFTTELVSCDQKIKKIMEARQKKIEWERKKKAGLLERAEENGKKREQLRKQEEDRSSKAADRDDPDASRQQSCAGEDPALEEQLREKLKQYQEVLAEQKQLEKKMYQPFKVDVLASKRFEQREREAKLESKQKEEETRVLTLKSKLERLKQFEQEIVQQKNATQAQAQDLKELYQEIQNRKLHETEIKDFLEKHRGFRSPQSTKQTLTSILAPNLLPQRAAKARSPGSKVTFAESNMGTYTELRKKMKNPEPPADPKPPVRAANGSMRSPGRIASPGRAGLVAKKSEATFSKPVTSLTTPKGSKPSVAFSYAQKPNPPPKIIISPRQSRPNPFAQFAPSAMSPKRASLASPQRTGPALREKPAPNPATKMKSPLRNEPPRSSKLASSKSHTLFSNKLPASAATKKDPKLLPGAHNTALPSVQTQNIAESDSSRDKIHLETSAALPDHSLQAESSDTLPQQTTHSPEPAQSPGLGVADGILGQTVSAKVPEEDRAGSPIIERSSKVAVRPQADADQSPEHLELSDSPKLSVEPPKEETSEPIQATEAKKPSEIPVESLSQETENPSEEIHNKPAEEPKPEPQEENKQPTPENKTHQEEAVHDQTAPPSNPETPSVPIDTTAATHPGPADQSTEPAKNGPAEDLAALQMSPVAINEAHDKSESESLKLALEENDEIVFDTPKKQSPEKAAPSEKRPGDSPGEDPLLEGSGLEFDFGQDEEDPNQLLKSMAPKPASHPQDAAVPEEPPKPKAVEEIDSAIAVDQKESSFDFEGLEEDGGADPNAI